MNKQNIINEIKSAKPRGAWNNAVKKYALDLLENLEGDEVTIDALLNGASTWSEYSYGGCAFIYDRDIAERLCTASELRRTRSGELPPNSRETWLDCQARALSHASRMILTII